MPLIKPEIGRHEALSFLTSYFGNGITHLRGIEAGEISHAYAFTQNECDYIIRFSTSVDGFERDRYAFATFAPQGLPIPRVYDIGQVDALYFAISEQADGMMLDRLSDVQRKRVLPVLVATLDRMHRADLGDYEGYGPVNAQGAGELASWGAAITAAFDEDCPGFWQGWRTLFRDTFLEQDIFDLLYTRMTLLVPFCPMERYLVHGDCHARNIISDGDTVTGVIDWANIKYGDFLYDVATLHLWSPLDNYPGLFHAYYTSQERSVQHYEERLLCYTYCLGLDTLRFFARTDQERPYRETRAHLLALPG